MGWFSKTKTTDGAPGLGSSAPKLRTVSSSHDKGGVAEAKAGPEVVIAEAPAGNKYGKRGGHVVQRSRANVNFVEDNVAPPEFDPSKSADPPPAHLRGPVLRLYVLKQQMLARVNALVGGDGGLAARHGFQVGDKGGARAAADGLVADLVGGPGALWLSGPDEAVAELHERVFENYNRWARMVGVCASTRQFIL